jgi:gluconolactonase
MVIQPKIVTLATDLNFPEGPTFDIEGRLWFTEVKAGCLTCFEGGKLERVKAGGNVNGMVFDSAGDIWFTDSENHRLRKYYPRERRFKEVLDAIEGERLNRPNDLAFDSCGNLVFSCHADGRTEPHGYLGLMTPDGHARVISRGKFFTNGIVFSADGKWMYFAETYKWRVWRAAWDAVNARLIEEHPWVETGGPIGPDGLALDVEGNLYVAVFDQSRIAVVSPNGKVIETIQLPVKRPTSCAFDPLGRYGLVVTDADRGCLLSLDIKRQGAKIFKR